MRCDTLRRIPPIRFFLVKSEWLVHDKGAPTRFMVASGVLSDRDGHGVCLGDVQKEAVTRWTRRRAAPAYAPIPDLTLISSLIFPPALLETADPDGEHNQTSPTALMPHTEFDSNQTGTFENKTILGPLPK